VKSNGQAGMAGVARLSRVGRVCINQHIEHVDERNKQVQLMHDIYSRAVRVVIWLGPDLGNEVSKAISGMDHIYAACIDIPPEDYDNFYKAPVLEREPVGNFDPQSVDDWVVLDQFFSHSWFFRVWCIQETTLAHDRLVLCGENEISWDKLHLTAEWIDDCQQRELNMPKHFKEIDIRGAISMHRVSKYDIDTSQAPLLELLNRFRHTLATDPRDKVYAILGLMEWKEEKTLVEVDYRKSVCEVYTDVVWATV
jgi:Heterokaryon incompatibility protein (HET)